MSARKIATWFLIGCAIAALLVGARMRTRRPDSESSTAGNAGASGSQNETSSAVQEKPLPTAAGQVVESVDSRTATDSADQASFGQVVDDTGATVPGARLSWTALISLDDVPPLNWQSVDWALVERNTLTTESNAQGGFAFEVAPTDATSVGSVMWVTATGYLAQRLILGIDEASWPRPARITLSRGSDCHVRVVDGSNMPVPSARVSQLGLGTTARMSRDALDGHAHRLYTRECTTDERGEALVSAFDGVQCVFASHGELQSMPWLAREGSLVTEIVLRLTPTYTVVGRVQVADAQLMDARSTFISAFALIGGVPKRQGQTRVNSDQSIGPWRLPVVTADEIRFALEGGGVQPREKAVPPPAASAVVELLFESRIGHSQPIRVVDDANSPIAGASVQMMAFVDGAWSKTRAVANSQGIANVRGCIDGSMVVDVEAAGFVSRRIENLQLSPENNALYELALQRAGIIEGKCLREGTPLLDFDVIYWTTNPREFSLASFFDRKDGSYSIEDAPLGAISIVASAKEVVRGEPIRIDVRADEVNHIDLELPRGSTGFGRVVDVRTLVGIADAEVALWASVGPTIQLKSSASTKTDAEGKFELSGFPIGNTAYEVLVPGYALHRAQTFASAERFDVGLITLAPCQTLEVTLSGGDAAEYRNYRLEMQGFADVEARNFDASGRALVPDLAPGRWYLIVRTPRNEMQSPWVDLVSGEVWSIDIPVGCDRTLAVRVEPQSGAALPTSLELRCTFMRSDGKYIDSYTYLPESGEVELRHVVSESATVDVLSNTRELLASAHSKLRRGANEVTLRLHDRRLCLRVVDLERRPIEGAQVVLSEPKLNAAWSAVAWTDALGEARFGNIAFDRVFVAFFHPAHGTRIETPVDVANADEERFEFVLDARASLRVELRDGDTPLPGVFVRLSDSGGAYNAFEGMSDGSARLETGRLGEGTYQMQVAHPGIWPVVVPVHALREAPDEVVQLRRLGALELAVRNAAGANLVDSEVGLRSLEFNVDVGEWIAAGRVSSSTQALRTDGQGVLRVNGLPRGAYGWSIGGVEGVASVPPLASVVVPIVVP